MTSGLQWQQVSAYLETHVPPRHAELERMEEYAREHRFPIIGPVAGAYCYQMARVIGAQRVFELGSGYGYSTAWFAQAVQENGGGVVHHAVWDAKLSQMARRHLSALGYDNLIEYHVGEAVTALKATDGPFDLIFNDIDKDGYPASLPPIADKLRPGGLLIIDNMFLGGNVLNGDNSPSAQGVREVTRQLTDSDQWITSIVPIRDGMIVALKK